MSMQTKKAMGVPAFPHITQEHLEPVQRNLCLSGVGTGVRENKVRLIDFPGERFWSPR